MILLAVAAGGTVGAICRHLTGVFFRRRLRSAFPWGTLTVNLVGAFFLGFCAAKATKGEIGEEAFAFLATGFCGAFTTFSTFALETQRLLPTTRKHAFMYILITVTGGILGNAIGEITGEA